MKRVLLGLGSNQPYDGKSPPQLLECARSALLQLLLEPVFSSVYKTRAMYVENQDDFYNMAALGFVPDNTDPLSFLETLNVIETRYGRDRTKEVRFGPRSLDIDIELFGNERIDHPRLQIPHPRMEERAFVLIPALEILTDSADVLIREKYSSCLQRLTEQGGAEGIVRLGGCQNGNGTDSGSDKACV